MAYTTQESGYLYFVFVHITNYFWHCKSYFAKSGMLRNSCNFKTCNYETCIFKTCNFS